MPDNDYYKILQVDPSAEPEVIEAAYKKLMLKYHPDQNKSPDATHKAQILNKAYVILKDPKKRREYDLMRFGKATQENYSHQSSNNARPNYNPGPQTPNSDYEKRRRDAEKKEQEEKQRAYRAEEARKVREKEEQIRREKEEQKIKEKEAFERIEKAAQERREQEEREIKEKQVTLFVIYTLILPIVACVILVMIMTL